MKWTAISGSWRKVNHEVQKDVEEVVRRVISRGDGIANGGALGVDYIATEIVLQEGDPITQLRIYLPIRLREMCRHYRKRAGERVITRIQAEMICSQLERAARESPESIFDKTKFKEANVESYYARNTAIIENCDELYAFQVNESQGTQDAIDKARSLGKKVVVKKYGIK